MLLTSVVGTGIAVHIISNIHSGDDSHFQGSYGTLEKGFGIFILLLVNTGFEMD